MRRITKQCNFSPFKMTLGALLALFAVHPVYSLSAEEPFMHSQPLMESVQQTVPVKGLVTDATGEPIIGANVLVKGTGNGVISDVNGNFTLNNVRVGSVINISYIGYLEQEIKMKI